MEPLFWLLLPVAALSGWLIARQSGPRSRRATAEDPLRGQYFQGLNYLLNEQPDKAIEVFTRMVEVDSDTAETHLALGNLFRRRGEVERAIRIHQNLIARPSLSRDQRTYALLALGEDYLRAGLLDRAENLFEEVVELNVHVELALGHLLDIYQQEKEWDRAIQAASRLEGRTGRPMAPMIAQFYCEQVEHAIKTGEPNQARNLLKRALTADPDCVRASILQGRLEQGVGNYKQALRAYQRVRYQDVEYLPEVLGPMGECYAALGRQEDFVSYLQSVQHEYDGVSLILMLAEQVRQREGDAAGIRYLTEQLSRRPSVRGLNRLIELNLSADPDASGHELHVLAGLFSELLRDKPVYRCGRCGFTGRTLHWHCPSCRNWASVKPIHGVEGE
ncbi:lipopolysaccharide biosynthesis regulator YciM [Natronocella acetinitrilica]|jgi:lipopolysaccharide assembly protein B|uniref:Lipopolysaccharide assembly protein B n=1 Tax=Natronocella acetinitrilica TaxID=414046 RepID=A0AAE3G486_9GAMM|nr:lipopolysaccharide assembly protein LapB [Natronocella acetinitrilica]MCP1674804.1 lipopolysaccharide biosynthesis regulator YciM [Natronocella acetinitrilica]